MPIFKIYKDLQGNLFVTRNDKLSTSSVTLMFKSADGDGIRLIPEHIPALITALTEYNNNLNNPAPHKKHEPATGRVALQPRRKDDMRKDALLASRKA
jgi:hypothetical protein